MSEEKEVIETPEADLEQRIADAVSKSLEAFQKPEEKEEPKEIDRKTDINPGQIEVGDELTPNWMKRTAMYLNAAVAHGQDRHADVRKYDQKLNEYNEQVNDQIRDFEHREAVKILKNAGLSRIKMVRALNTIENAEGGFLLPKPFLAELFVIIEERGAARNLLRGIPMGNRDLDLKSVANKPITFWTGEGEDIDVTDVTFDEKQLTTNGLKSLLPWTTEFEEDEVFGFMPVVQELFAEAIYTQEDLAAFIGDGSATYGGFTGILNLENAVEFAPEGVLSANDYTADHYRWAIESLSLARRRNARWIFHPSHLAHLETLQTDDGHYIYRRPVDATSPGHLWGFPISVVETMPNLENDSDDWPFAIFGDPNRTLFGTRRGITLMTSRDGAITAGNNVVFNALSQDGAILRVTERVGFQTPDAYESAYVILKTDEDA